MRNALVFCGRKLICPVLVAAIGLVSFVGCDEQKEGPVVDTTKHGENTSKNQMDFMKQQASQPKEKAVTKPATK
jgi:hypothetical protein